jgi:hypothetical protein
MPSHNRETIDRITFLSKYNRENDNRIPIFLSPNCENENRIVISFSPDREKELAITSINNDDRSVGDPIHFSNTSVVRVHRSNADHLAEGERER